MSTEPKFTNPEPMDVRIARAMVDFRKRPAADKFQSLVELGFITQAQADAAIARMKNSKDKQLKAVRNRKSASLQKHED